MRVEQDNHFIYSIHQWLPLTRSENFKAYLQLEGISQQAQFLENILAKHILSFYKGMGLFPETRIQATLLHIDKQYTTRFKKLSQQAFHLKFKTNAFVPHFVGIGKGASLGYGIVR